MRTTQTVILTNLYQAQLVYSARILLPDLWDPMFSQAMVATLAARFVQALGRNASLYKDQLAIARDIVLQARVSDGDEGVTSQNHQPDWISVRGAGYPALGFGGTSYLWWDNFSLGGASF